MFLRLIPAPFFFFQVCFWDAGGRGRVQTTARKISRSQTFYSDNLTCKLQIRGWLQGKRPGFQHTIAHLVSYYSGIQKLFQRIQYCMTILLIVNQAKKKPKQAPKPNIPTHPEKEKRHKGELNLYLQYFHCFSASHNYVSVIK